MSDTVIISFGRFNPLTTGHELLVNTMKVQAKMYKADLKLYMSHSHDSKKNPLSYNDKIRYGKKAFGNIVIKSNAKTFIDVIKEQDGKYKNLIVIVGGDRIKDIERLVTTYNGRDYNFDSVAVISAGKRVEGATDVSGMSASKLRGLAVSGDIENFAKGLPKNLKSDYVSIYNKVRQGMKIKESLDKNLYEMLMNIKSAERKSIHESTDLDKEKETVTKREYRRRGHAISFDEDGNPSYDRRLKNFRNVFPKKETSLQENTVDYIRLVEAMIRFGMTDREARIMSEILSLSEDVSRLTKLASDSSFLGTEGMMQHILACSK